MSLITDMRNGRRPEFLSAVAEKEKVSTEALCGGILQGHIVVPRNSHRPSCPPVAVGKGLFTKVNANIGTSRDRNDLDHELNKARVALKYGADAIMDLSTWGDLQHIRTIIMEHIPLPLGTVPVYELACGLMKSGRSIEDASIEDFFAVIEKQAQEGVDFMTIHAGVCRDTLAVLREFPRTLGIVSRGGALTARWMTRNSRENPYFEFYDRLLDILAKHDVTISLGDAMRPGCQADATDRVQLKELALLGELAERAFQKGVQVMIEGPGHVPLHQIELNMKLQQALCHNRPFYVLGPLVTDIAPGYDHITSAIGGAIAAAHGADFLCYVTPAEHLKLPDIEDVKLGVIASRIAAHAADIVKRGRDASDRDLTMSCHRRKRDWKQQIACAIDPERAGQLHAQGLSQTEDVCTMCSEFCPIRMLDEDSGKPE
jgi:phosphomethylpyrimidine synthase